MFFNPTQCVGLFRLVVLWFNESQLYQLFWRRFNIYTLLGIWEFSEDRKRWLRGYTILTFIYNLFTRLKIFFKIAEFKKFQQYLVNLFETFYKLFSRFTIYYSDFWELSDIRKFLSIKEITVYLLYWNFLQI